MKRHFVFVQIRKYSMLKSSSCASSGRGGRIAGVLFLLAVESRLADAQQECGGELVLCPRHHSNPHTARAFAMSVAKSSSLEKTAVIPRARASFSMFTS